MSVTVIVSLKVAEFSKWKAAHQNIDDPNNAIVIVTAPSKEAFLAFFTRPETQKMQKKAGVLGPPEIKFINPA